MKLYTLRHKKTGEFMPCNPCSSRATGFTLWTPGDKTRRAVDANPRIFYTLRSAQLAKAAWVRGWHTVTTDYTGDEFGNFECRVESVVDQPEIPRRNDDLEIMILQTSDWVSIT